MHEFKGGCHCGNLTVAYGTVVAPEATEVRLCTCAFCRKHGARSISDPDGRIRFAARDPALVSRYRFGLGTADFLVCAVCGVYVGALMPDGDRAFAIANANCLDEAARFTRPAARKDYSAEDAAARVARRRRRWMPAAPGIGG
jgi:hypothetical protein